MTVIIRKKIKLDTRVKAGILVSLSCVVLFLGIGIYKETTTHKIINEEQIVYNYTCQPKVEYAVHIQENKVYEEMVQGEGINYSKKLLDYIEVNFGTEFQGSGAAEVELIYRITAQVQGYENIAGDKLIVNWSKTYELEKETKKLYSENYFLQEQTEKFNLEKYDEFAVEAIEVTGMQLSSQVLVCMVGNVKIVSEYGELNTPIEISITIPLLSDIFAISKTEVESISDNIINYTDVIVPTNKNIILLFSFLLVVCIVVIVSVLLITEAPDAYDILKSKARKLLKNYGSRMIALLSKTEQTYLQIYDLGSIEDLIKVSDEIQKPIYYLKDDIDLIGDYTLQVVDNDILYVYRVI